MCQVTLYDWWCCTCENFIETTGPKIKRCTKSKAPGGDVGSCGSKGEETKDKYRWCAECYERREEAKRRQEERERAEQEG